MLQCIIKNIKCMNENNVICEQQRREEKSTNSQLYSEMKIFTI